MTVHVYPINDWIDHDIESSAADCQCPCEPTIKYLDDDGSVLPEPIVVHNAIDQRELTESENDDDLD